MTDSENKVLNREVMKALIGDDTEMIRKFEIEFLQQAKVSMSKFTKLYQDNAFKPMKEEAHFLKTSAKAIGAECLAQHLENMEHIAQKENKEMCKQQLIQINSALKAVYGAVVNES